MKKKINTSNWQAAIMFSQYLAIVSSLQNRLGRVPILMLGIWSQQNLTPVLMPPEGAPRHLSWGSLLGWMDAAVAGMSLPADPGWVAPNMGNLKPKASQSWVAIPEALRRSLYDLIINHKDRTSEECWGRRAPCRERRKRMDEQCWTSFSSYSFGPRLVTRGGELVKLWRSHIVSPGARTLPSHSKQIQNTQISFSVS